MEKMTNLAAKTAWVQALRSGEFQQGRGRLVRETEAGLKHCCLGVLSELAAREGVVRRVGEGVLGFAPPSDGLAWDYTQLPHSVSAWAGLSGPQATNPTVLPPAGYPALPRSVTHLFGVRRVAGVPLSWLNDGGTLFGQEKELIAYPTLSFNQIADLIEEHL